jgi:hypothetical protein
MFEQASEQNAAAYEKALYGLGSPRFLSPQITAFLAKTSKVALDRMRLENSALDGIEGEIDGIDVRIHQLMAKQESLQGHLSQRRKEEKEFERGFGHKLNGSSQLPAIADEISEVETRLAQLRTRRAELQAKARPLHERQKNCSSFCIRAASVAGREDRAIIWNEPPPFQKVTIKEMRARIVDLNERLEQAKKLPLSSKYAAQVVEQRLLKPHGTFRGLLRGVISSTEGGEFPEMRFQRTVIGGDEVQNYGPLVLRAIRPLILQVLEEDRKAESRDDAGAVLPEERTRRCKALESEILESQRMIESIIWAAQREGKEIDLPADSPAETILFARKPS